MRLRFLPVIALALLALGGLAGSSSSATAPPTIGPFLGTWTMTAVADPVLAGAELQITASTAGEAKSLVGPEWTNPTETAWYDSHCGSKATVYAYVVLQYTWSPQASMGGCFSNKTVPHVIFAGLHKDAGTVRVLGSAGGLDTLKGTWDTIDNHICCTHHPIAGARPSVEFTVGEQGHVALPKRREGPKFLLTRLVGVGAASLADGATSGDVDISDATGTIHFHKWRVFEHGVIDEDLLVLKVEKIDLSRYRVDADSGEVRHIGVVVTKAGRDETDDCPVGAKGTMSMTEETSGPRKGSDYVLLALLRCHVLETFENGLHSAKVAVGLKYNKP